MAFQTKLVLKSSGFRVVQTLVTVVIGFLMMPFLISTLGENLYGLWIVIGSVVGTYYLLDIGFSQAITRYVAKYIHQKNAAAANRVINTALVLYSVLGILVLFISIIAASIGVESLMKDSQHVSLAQVLLVISGLTLALEFPAKSFPGIVSAYMRYDFIALMRMIKTIADALLIYCFLKLGYGLVAMAVITMITGLCSTAMYVRFTSRLFGELAFSKRYVDLATLKDVFHFSKWVCVIDVNNMLRGKMDIWFIAFFQSNAILTVYYVAVRLTEYALQFLTQATGITGPIFTEYYAKEEYEKLRQSVIAFIKLDVLLGVSFFTGFYLVGESFIRLWMGSEFAYSEAYLCLIVLAVGKFSAYFSSPLQSLLMTMNRHNFSAWTSMVETVGSVVLLWLLVPQHGIVGAALAITIPGVIGRLIIVPVLVSRIFSIGFGVLIIRICLFLIMTAAFILFCQNNVQMKGLGLKELFFTAPMLGVVQVLFGIILFDYRERVWVLEKLKITALIEKLNRSEDR